MVHWGWDIEQKLCALSYRSAATPLALTRLVNISRVLLAASVVPCCTRSMQPWSAIHSIQHLWTLPSSKALISQWTLRPLLKEDGWRAWNYSAEPYWKLNIAINDTSSTRTLIFYHSEEASCRDGDACPTDDRTMFDIDHPKQSDEIGVVDHCEMEVYDLGTSLLSRQAGPSVPASIYLCAVPPSWDLAPTR